MEKELSLSETTKVVVEPLDGFQTMKADAIVANFGKLDMENPMAQLVVGKVYGVAMIRSINGEKVDPLATLDTFRAIASKLTSNEVFALVEAVNEQFAGMTDDNAKNSSTPAPSLES